MTVETVPAPEPKKDRKASAILAWYDADTDEKKAVVVKSYPELENIFSQAQTILNSK